jgi:type VI secretion system secreted protein VgrG
LITKRDMKELIERDEHIYIKRDQIELIERDHHLEIKGKEAIKVGGSHSFEVSGAVAEKFGANHSEETAQSIYIKGGMSVVIEAGVQLTIKAGSSFVDIGPSGVTIQGTMVLINSGGAAGSGSAGTLVSPTKPDEAEVADNADPGDKAETYKHQRAAMSPAQWSAYNAPSHNPSSEENKKERKSWIEIELVNDEGEPVPGEKYRVTLPDGSTLAEGTLDEKGYARVSSIDPGSCKVTFPKLDQEAWEPK